VGVGKKLNKAYERRVARRRNPTTISRKKKKISRHQGSFTWLKVGKRGGPTSTIVEFRLWQKVRFIERFGERIEKRLMAYGKKRPAIA